MVQSSRRASRPWALPVRPGGAKGRSAVQHIREDFHDLYIGEQFGKFDPARLETFFTPLLRRSPEGHAVSFAAVVERLQTLENPYPGPSPVRDP